jgi:hypothetical protein
MMLKWRSGLGNSYGWGLDAMVQICDKITSCSYHYRCLLPRQRTHSTPSSTANAL